MPEALKDSDAIMISEFPIAHPGRKDLHADQRVDLLKEIVGNEEDRELTADYYAPDVKVRINAKAQVKDSSLE